MLHSTEFPSRIISFLRKTKIQYRLLAIFCFISLVPVTCVCLFSYGIYTNSINSKLSDSFYQAIVSLNQNMILELGKIQTVATTLSSAEEIQEILHLYSDSTQPNINENSSYISQEIRNNIIYSEYVRSIRIISSSGTLIYDMGYEYFSEDSFPEILGGIDRMAPQPSLQYAKSYLSQDRLVLGSKCYSVGYSDVSSGYIMLFIDEPLIYQKIFSNISFGGESDIMMLDAQGTVLTAQNRELVGSSLKGLPLFLSIQAHLDEGSNVFRIKESGNDSLIVFTYNSQYGYYLVGQIPRSYITSETRMINLALLFLAILLILLSLCCTMVIYFSIVTPIRNMVDFCNMPIADMSLADIHDNSPDELGFLAVTMESMLHNLHESMEQNKEDEHKKRKLEIQMLQYQINPHFLFNTLNSLQWVAVINDVPVLAEGISSLSTLLRNALMKKDELISLEEEVGNLKNYFTIQKIRYGNSFDVEYLLAENTLQHLIPRFILQPLAENSIVHGISGSAAVVMITVLGRYEKSGLVIEIRDNGKGFSENGNCTDDEKRQSTGIGINNVKERLRLHYGRADLLQIMSEEGKGTLCRITIPVN